MKPKTVVSAVMLCGLIAVGVTVFRDYSSIRLSTMRSSVAPPSQIWGRSGRFGDDQFSRRYFASPQEEHDYFVMLSRKRQLDEERQASEVKRQSSRSSAVSMDSSSGDFVARSGKGVLKGLEFATGEGKVHEAILPVR